VLPEVEQHVDHARAHLPRRRERAGVVPIADHLPPAAEQAIHRQSQPDREPVHAAARAARLVSLDDEVTVILLDREMDDSKASTEARAMARLSALNSRGERRDGSPGAARMVTCIGYLGSILGRVTCGIDGRPLGLRPAPFRAPPHVLAAASGSRICRARPDLIPHMFRLRRGRRRVASRGCAAQANRERFSQGTWVTGFADRAS
jgi:hypothetical protein